MNLLDTETPSNPGRDHTVTTVQKADLSSDDSGGGRRDATVWSIKCRTTDFGLASSECPPGSVLQRCATGVGAPTVRPPQALAYRTYTESATHWRLRRRTGCP